MHNALNQSVRRNPTGNALSRGGIQYGGGAQPEQPPRTVMNALMQTPLRTLLEYQAAQVPNKLRGFGQAVGDSYKKAIDTGMSLAPTVMGGTAPPEATERHNKANLELVADMAAIGFGSEVPKGALRSLGGMSAKTADKAALQQAQDLTAKGADRNQIWKETGWYEDVDGQWKFEIDDSASRTRLPDEPKISEGKVWQSEDVLEHPPLYGSYPKSSSIMNASEGHMGGGSWSARENTIYNNNLRTSPNYRSVQLHEQQHAIQDAEDFARGGNTATARDSVTLDYYRRAGVHYRDKKEYDSHNEDRAAFMQADYYTKLDELSKAANPKPSMVTNMSDWYRWSTEIRDTIGIQPKKAGPARDEWVRGAAAFLRNKHLEEMNGSLTSSQINKFNSVVGDRKQAKAAALKAGRKMEKLQPAATKMRDIDKLRKAHDRRTDFEIYQRLAGEAEARNVQTRMDYTPEQRRATPPWETLDVPEDELIVRVGGGGKSMSTKPFPDTLPLTGRLRGELLNLERTETLKTAPGKVVQDLISKGHWPEELRQDALGFLNGVPARHAQRNELKSSGVDSLAYRKPGHAVENFASQKRNAERAEIEAFRKSQIVSSANELKNIDASGLWNKKFSDDINTAAESANIWGMPYIKGAVNKANMEAVPRQLKKEGWTVRHGSKGNSGRKSSRYIVSPDGKYEVRLSDHELPDTPQRQHSRDTFGAPRWNDEIVLTGGESPADVIAEVKRLYAEGLE